MVTVQKDPKVKEIKGEEAAAVSGGSPGKESEPGITFEDEAKIVAEIQDRSSALDKEKLDQVRAEIPETKHAFPEPEIPPELEDAGVINPQTEADRVISQGTSLNLPFSEEEYNKGLHVKIAGKIVDKAVVGVSSVVALSMWIGRLVKMAHKHAMKVVFRGDK